MWGTGYIFVIGDLSQIFIDASKVSIVILIESEILIIPSFVWVSKKKSHTIFTLNSTLLMKTTNLLSQNPLIKRPGSDLTRFQ